MLTVRAREPEEPKQATRTYSPQDRILLYVFQEFVGTNLWGWARFARIFLNDIRHFDCEECFLTVSFNYTCKYYYVAHHRTSLSVAFPPSVSLSSAYDFLETRKPQNLLIQW